MNALKSFENRTDKAHHAERDGYVVHDLTADEITVGLAAQFDRAVTEQDILAFADNSGDHNPLHVNATYAAGTNHGGRIAHGAFQVGLASAMIGMYLPGRRVLLSSLQARFPAPLKFPSQVRVRGQIVAWNRGTRSGRLAVTVTDTARELVTADIGMGFTLHEDRNETAPLATPVDRAHAPPVSVATERRTVVVTGASGGIGRRLLESLGRSFDVIATVNRGELPAELHEHPHIHPIRLDFAQPDWSDTLSGSLPEAGLFAVVHSAWPSLPKGGLLHVPTELIHQQIAYGTTHLIDLARLLASRVGDGGGRLIAIGSIAGRQKPTVNMAAYSLGKSALEDTVRLLAPELAAKKITANALCPNFLPVGMNRHADERRHKLEVASIPMGRACQPDDILGAVEWLLSDSAGFISGQIIGINGAQL